MFVTALTYVNSFNGSIDFDKFFVSFTLTQTYYTTPLQQLPNKAIESTVKVYY